QRTEAQLREVSAQVDRATRELAQQKQELALQIEQAGRATQEANDKLAIAMGQIEATRNQKAGLEARKIEIEAENQRLINKQKQLREGDWREVCKELMK
ncbi:MAG TPA: hypothetical protein VL172_19165, partial [Kofleriaceae bacterium]|nr:hypothetical protein [Kofleriaceae bacterium]